MTISLFFRKFFQLTAKQTCEETSKMAPEFQVSRRQAAEPHIEHKERRKS